MVPNDIKEVGINLTKNIHQKLQTLLVEIQGDLNKWRNTPC